MSEWGLEDPLMEGHEHSQHKTGVGGTPASGCGGKGSSISHVSPSLRRISHRNSRLGY